MAEGPLSNPFATKTGPKSLITGQLWHTRRRDCDREARSEPGFVRLKAEATGGIFRLKAEAAFGIRSFRL
jgi:hypothetical protein